MYLGDIASCCGAGVLSGFWGSQEEVASQMDKKLVNVMKDNYPKGLIIAIISKSQEATALEPLKNNGFELLKEVAHYAHGAKRPSCIKLFGLVIKPGDKTYLTKLREAKAAKAGRAKLVQHCVGLTYSGKLIHLRRMKDDGTGRESLCGCGMKKVHGFEVDSMMRAVNMVNGEGIMCKRCVAAAKKLNGADWKKAIQ